MTEPSSETSGVSAHCEGRHWIGYTTPLHFPLLQSTLPRRLRRFGTCSSRSSQLPFGSLPKVVLKKTCASSDPLKAAPLFVTPFIWIVPPGASVGFPVF